MVWLWNFLRNLFARLAQRIPPFLSSKVLSAIAGALLTLIAIALIDKNFLSHILSSEFSIDWSGPQEKAVITLSDPQVYSREALINDRRQETEFLIKLLQNSGDEVFLPHIRQTLDTFNALKSSAGLKLNEGSLSTSSALPGTQEDRSRTSANASAISETHQSNTADFPKTAGTAQAALNSKDDKAHELPSQGYPREWFRDLQSYRADIRAALASANLDDLHDYNGQALYRLQFHATVLPGKHSNKFGIAELRILPPELDQDQKKRIYLAWLRHATSRVNLRSMGNDPQSERVDPRYIALDQSSDVLGLLRLECPGFDPKTECVGMIALPKSALTDVNSFLLNHSELQELVKKAKGERVNLALETDNIPRDNDQASEDLCLKEAEKGTNKNAALLQYYSYAKKTYALGPYLAASLDALKERFPTPMGRPDLAPNYAASKVEKLRSANDVLIPYFAILKNKVASCANVSVYITKARRDNDYVPKVFDELLDSLLIEQRAYAYTTTPAELAQRVSNALSTATTLEMALALAAHNSTSGTASSTLLHDAKKTLEGVERLPLVVGFADRTDRDDTPKMGEKEGQSGPEETQPTKAKATLQTYAGRSSGRTQKKLQIPNFGWIFGPKQQTHSDNPRLEQTVSHYELAADVSVPGWWPEIKMELRTFWVSNWHETASVLKVKAPATHELRVPIPLLTPPDLESLTEALTKNLTGPWGHLPPQMVIQDVYPSAVSACMETVTFVIHGDNLWRDAEVYWEGVKGKNITILPRMAGITAKFEIKDMIGAEKKDLRKLRVRRTTLLVATRGAIEPWSIEFHGHRTGEMKSGCEGPSVSAQDSTATTDLAPRIHAVSPNVLYSCPDLSKVTFFIKGANLLTYVYPKQFDPTKPPREIHGRVLFGGTDSTLSPILKEAGPAPMVMQANFLNMRLPRATTELRIPLTVATPAGLDSHDIIILPCNKS